MAATSANQPLRGVMVGSGHFAPIQLEAWQQVEGAQIVALISTGNQARLAELAARFGISHWGPDLSAALRALQPDFVDIVTPPFAHGEGIRTAADHGLAILVQKPIAPTWAEARNLVGYAEARGAQLLVNENWRWQPWYRQVRQLLGEGSIGTPFQATYRVRPGDGWGERPYAEQPYFAELPRFLLIETGIHYVDTTRYMLGEIETVTCVTRRVNPVIAAEDMAVAVFGLASDCTTVLDANRSAFASPVRSPAFGTLTIEGTGGTLTVSQHGALHVTGRDGKRRRHQYRIPPGWRGGSATAAQQHAADALARRVKPETPGRDYLRTMQVIEACYLSAQQGRTISVGHG
jgi:D-apiose dehydrogenase